MERLLEQHRRVQTGLAEELEVARKRQETGTALKLAARRHRKQKDIEHRAQEVAAKVVLAEQQKQRHSSTPEVSAQPADSTLVGLGSVTAAVPADKEAALQKALARRRAELAKRQEEQRAALAAECDKEEAAELRQLMAEADAERKRAENELRQRQAAELAARKASGEDVAAMAQLHARQLAELMDRLDAQRQRHDLALRQRLAARRQKRQEDLRRQQEAALRREELAAEAEAAELRQGAYKEAENAAMAKGVEENGEEDAPRVVAQVRSLSANVCASFFTANYSTSFTTNQYSVLSQSIKLLFYNQCSIQSAHLSSQWRAALSSSGPGSETGAGDGCFGGALREGAGGNAD